MLRTHSPRWPFVVAKDPHEWSNLARDPNRDPVKARLRQSAPRKFADPGPVMRRRRHLVIEGETFRWDPSR